MALGDTKLGRQLQAKVTTTNATPAILFELEIPDKYAALVEVDVSGQHATDWIHETALVFVYRDGAAATLVEVFGVVPGGSGSGTWSIDYTCVGTKLRCTVIGENGHTIVWTGIPLFEPCAESFA